MSGSTTGSLSVYFSGTGTVKTLAFTKSNDHGNEWIPAEVNIPAVQNLQVQVFFKKSSIKVFHIYRYVVLES